jgi:polyisoprenoid-binding protein YceI
MLSYKVVADGTKANYRVREQLAGLDAPSDAVGTTTAVTGSLVMDADGQIVPDQSKLVVDLKALHSDRGNRDRFIQFNTLETSEYPTATFVPTRVTGLPSPLPRSGQATFQILGNLTIHGVTKPVTWDVTAQANGNDVTGQATTQFTFEDFGMTPPKAGPVLSVNDNVKLEVTLHLAKVA